VAFSRLHSMLVFNLYRLLYHCRPVLFHSASCSLPHVENRKKGICRSRVFIDNCVVFLLYKRSLHFYSLQFKINLQSHFSRKIHASTCQCMRSFKKTTYYNLFAVQHTSTSRSSSNRLQYRTRQVILGSWMHQFETCCHMPSSLISILIVQGILAA